MPDGVVEITQKGVWVTKHRGFLTVQSGKELVGRVPLDDIVTVIIATPYCSITASLIDHLSSNNIPLVICGSNYVPSTWTLPVSGYSHQFQVMQAQAKLTQPKRKRAWQSVIRAKILNQKSTLKMAKLPTDQFDRLANAVRSGDTANCEAQAARLYWTRLFGKKFKRDQQAPGLNALLNYTYAIIRSCVARGITAAGLHPSFSIHHKNPHNPVNLIEDLIEPYRPLADYLIWRRGYRDDVEITPSIKEELATVVSRRVLIEGDKSPLSIATVKTCRSFAAYCINGEGDLVLPQMIL